MNAAPAISVLIPTHDPHAGRLRRTLVGLRAQSLPADDWELVLIDNASREPVDPAVFAGVAPKNSRAVREPQLGLTSARRRGLTEAHAALCVFVDDDNVLAPDYLAHVVQLFAAHPRLGACGGKSLPEFETEPPAWSREFLPLLALRDLGNAAVVASTLKPDGATRNTYPAAAAPIGAGMALRREAVQGWLDHTSAAQLPDRRGGELTSGGDNDIVFTVLAHGWHVGYFPELSLTHLIPAGRLAPDYLARLNRGIQQSWMRVLTKHDANPWSAIATWSVAPRKIKAWFTHRGWQRPAGYVRWQGACGHFEGRTPLPR